MSSPIRHRWGARKPPLGTPIGRGHPLAIGLVSAWTFSEAGGKAIRDWAGKAHLSFQPGTGSAVWGSNVFGSLPALTGGGTGPYLTTTVLPVAVGKNVSFGAWFVANSTAQVGRILYSGNSGTNGWGLHQNDGAGGAGATVTILTDGVSFSATGSGYTLTAGQKTFLLATGNNANLWTLYANGIKHSSGTSTGLAPTVGTGLGASPGGFETWNGWIDQAFLWTRALSAGEAMALQLDPYALYRGPARPRSYRVAAAGAVPATFDLSPTSATTRPRLTPTVMIPSS